MQTGKITWYFSKIGPVPASSSSAAATKGLDLTHRIFRKKNPSLNSRQILETTQFSQFHRKFPKMDPSRCTTVLKNFVWHEPDHQTRYTQIKSTFTYLGFKRKDVLSIHKAATSNTTTTFITLRKAPFTELTTVSIQRISSCLQLPADNIQCHLVRTKACRT